ncbi:hypothetical protein MSPP1_003573 [Malassezia sp. CBS 17886]|nr:hypothetical protein MSPP1_003573 [Malassezia sp. CBS 17886]
MGAQVTPLHALTESAQRDKPAAPDTRKKRASARPPPRRRAPGKKATVAFDEDARREFLTGFSKRKQQRKLAAQQAQQAKIRDELRESRRAAADARKQLAAENVRAEQLAYGTIPDELGEDEADEPLQEERDYETEERRAHVTVQELDLDGDWHAPPSGRRAGKDAPQRPAMAQDAPTRRAAPRTAPRAAARPTPTPPSGSLTAILEPDVAAAAQSRSVFPTTEPSAAPTNAKRSHTYLSTAERNEEHKRQRARNHVRVERRRAENCGLAKVAGKKKKKKIVASR